MSELVASSIRLKNLGPIGDEMADTIAPKDKQQIDPRQLQQHMQEMGQQLQQLQGIAAQQKQALDTEQVKTQGQIQIKQLDLQFQREKVQRESETKIAVAELGAKVDRLQLFLEERARLGTQAMDVASTLFDAGHDRRMQATAHAQALQQTDQQTAQQAALAAQAHQHALEQATLNGAQAQPGGAAEPAETGAGA
jgi:hypothetical protein